MSIIAWEVTINGKTSAHASIALAMDHMRINGTGTMKAVWA
jgi:hypothetical protein